MFPGTDEPEGAKASGPGLEGHSLHTQLGPSPGRSKKAARGSQRNGGWVALRRTRGVRQPPPCTTQGFKSTYTSPVPLTSQRNPTLHYNDVVELPSAQRGEVLSHGHTATVTDGRGMRWHSLQSEHMWIIGPTAAPCC